MSGVAGKETCLRCNEVEIAGLSKRQPLVRRGRFKTEGKSARSISAQCCAPHASLICRGLVGAGVTPSPGEVGRTIAPRVGRVTAESVSSPLARRWSGNPASIAPAIASNL